MYDHENQILFVLFFLASVSILHARDIYILLVGVRIKLTMMVNLGDIDNSGQSK